MWWEDDRMTCSESVKRYQMDFTFQIFFFISTQLTAFRVSAALKWMQRQVDHTVHAHVCTFTSVYAWYFWLRGRAACLADSPRPQSLFYQLCVCVCVRTWKRQEKNNQRERLCVWNQLYRKRLHKTALSGPLWQAHTVAAVRGQSSTLHTTWCKIYKVLYCRLVPQGTCSLWWCYFHRDNLKNKVCPRNKNSSVLLLSQGKAWK